MVVKFRIENLSEINKDYLLRCSGKTIISGIEIQSEIEYLSKKYVFQPLKTKFNILSGYAFKSEDFSSDNSLVPVIRIGDIGNDDALSDCVFIGEDFLQSQKDFILKENDILVGLTGDGKLKCSINEGDKPKLLNQRVGALRPKEQNTNIKFYYYLLNSSIVKKQFLRYSNGKTQLNISPFDFLKIKVPELSQDYQDKIVKELEPIEQKIRQLKSTIKPVQEVINEVFSREFGFSKNLYQEFGKGMTASSQRANTRKLKIFSKDFLSIGNNKNTRFSTRYHNPPTEKLMSIINNMQTKKVKDVVINNDKGIQPNYSTEGTIPVIKIANMKNLEIDFSECEFISEGDYLQLNEDKKIKRGDIIICGTGKASLGKIDIYESDDDAVTTVDNIVLRLSNNYNKLFFVYFFRSILGYFQIERDFTGATNQIHLYRDGVSEFLIPDISLSEQEKIVEEIQTEIDKQNKIRKDIQQERNKIDEIIENAIR